MLSFHFLSPHRPGLFIFNAHSLKRSLLGKVTELPFHRVVRITVVLNDSPNLVFVDCLAASESACLLPPSHSSARRIKKIFLAQIMHHVSFTQCGSNTRIYLYFTDTNSTPYTSYLNHRYMSCHGHGMPFSHLMMTKHLCPWRICSLRFVSFANAYTHYTGTGTHHVPMTQTTLPALMMTKHPSPQIRDGDCPAMDTCEPGAPRLPRGPREEWLFGVCVG